jgi:hypothetical protein
MAYLGRFPRKEGKEQAQKDPVEGVYHGACETSGNEVNVESPPNICNGNSIEKREARGPGMSLSP